MGARVALQDGRIAYAIDVDTLSRRGDAPAIRQEAEKVTGQDGKAYFRVDQESCCGSVLKIVAVAFLILLSGGILGVVLCFSSRASEYFLGHQIQVVDQAAYDLRFPLQPNDPSASENEGEPAETPLKRQLRERALLMRMGFNGPNAVTQFEALKRGDLNALTPQQINNVEQMKAIINAGNKAVILSQLVVRWIRGQECGCLVALCVEDPKLLRAAIEDTLRLQSFLEVVPPGEKILEANLNAMAQMRLFVKTIFEGKIAPRDLEGDSLETFRAQQQEVDAAFNAMFEPGAPFDAHEDYPILEFVFFNAELIGEWVRRFGVQVLAYVPVGRLIESKPANLNMRIPFVLGYSEPVQEQIDVANNALRRAGYSAEQLITVVGWQISRPLVHDTKSAGDRGAPEDERLAPTPPPRDI